MTISAITAAAAATASAIASSAAAAAGTAATVAGTIGSGIASGVGALGASTLGSVGVTAAADSALAYTVGGLSAAASLASAGMGAYEGVSGYQQGRAQAGYLRSAAAAAKSEADAQAAEKERQARLEAARAGVAQIGAEQEAERRSRILAQDIGSMYASYAGNGLALDGTAKDTIGAALRTQVGEARSDISTIRDNAAMEVWTHQANARSYMASAANARMAGRSQAALYRRQAKSALRSGRTGLYTGLGRAALSLGSMALGVAGGWGRAAGGAAGVGKEIMLSNGYDQTPAADLLRTSPMDMGRRMMA